ncbi:MAG: GNAT family N-acetyltransferase [Arenicella sp.]|nr:GNAT family N-acetyltransferase [Arenicella sp.]
MSALTIRPATTDDVDQIMQFVIDLAIYEKEQDAVVATSEHFRSALFCDNPQAHCLIADFNGESVGFALYFFSFSTWLGQHGIYLEDLYVTPESRGLGAGKALLKELSKIAVKKNFGRVEWSVLDWNEPSIKFYQAMGAKTKPGWTVFRLADQALCDFANS